MYLKYELDSEKETADSGYATLRWWIEITTL